MSFAAVNTIEKKPPQYCAGRVKEVTEPKIAKNGMSYITFRIEGEGSSPDSNFTLFFMPEWFEKGFNPSSLENPERDRYGALIANDKTGPFALPALRVILGDQGYDLFSRKCHDVASIREEFVQESLVSTINEVGQELFGYTLCQKVEPYTEKVMDASGSEQEVTKWRTTKLWNIRDPRPKDQRGASVGLFRLNEAAMKTVTKATNNPKFGVSHITQEVIPF